MKPDIYIRTDAWPEIGLGHLIRCISLANILKNDFNISFFCAEIPERIIDEICSGGFQCFSLDNEEDFINKLDHDNIVLLDGYHFTSDYQKAIKDTCASLICIDDLHDRFFYADLIINYAPGIKSTDYKATPYTEYALGLDYAFTRPAFMDVFNSIKTIERIESALICFGGSDYKNITERILKVILSFDQLKKIIVVTGPSYTLTDSISILEQKDKRITHHHAVGEKQMCGLMSEADLMIVPASGILYEALTVGGVIVTGMYVDNQQNIYKGVIEFEGVYDAKNFSDSDLEKAVSEAFKNPKPVVAKLKSIESSRATLLKLVGRISFGKVIKLRKVNRNDLLKTFEWATNESIRASSFSTHLISQEEHSTWFHKKILDNNCIYLIADYEGSFFGTLRFDLQDGDARISYLIDPLYQGKGFGSVLLSKGIEYLINSCDAVKELTGLVLKTNVPSIKVFERLGFSSIAIDNYFSFKKVVKKYA